MCNSSFGRTEEQQSPAGSRLSAAPLRYVEKTQAVRVSATCGFVLDKVLFVLQIDTSSVSRYNIGHIMLYGNNIKIKSKSIGIFQ